MEQVAAFLVNEAEIVERQKLMNRHLDCFMNFIFPRFIVMFSAELAAVK